MAKIIADKDPLMNEGLLDMFKRAGRLLDGNEEEDIVFKYRPHAPINSQCTIFLGEHSGTSICSLKQAEAHLRVFIFNREKEILHKQFMENVRKGLNKNV